MVESDYVDASGAGRAEKGGDACVEGRDEVVVLAPESLRG